VLRSKIQGTVHSYESLKRVWAVRTPVQEISIQKFNILLDKDREAPALTSHCHTVHALPRFPSKITVHPSGTVLNSKFSRYRCTNKVGRPFPFFLYIFVPHSLSDSSIFDDRFETSRLVTTVYTRLDQNFFVTFSSAILLFQVPADFPRSV
jgi:hypothetical protein